VRKPVQSGAETPSDADVLGGATAERADDVCLPHRRYRLAWAPPMAATELGRPAFTVADLVGELAWPDGTQVGLVEGAGGPRSPIASDGDNVDFARALAPDAVVLVAEAGLGAINAVRLAADALSGFELHVALNRFGDDALHARNREFLADRAGLHVVVTPAELSTSLAG